MVVNAVWTTQDEWEYWKSKVIAVRRERESDTSLRLDNLRGCE